ncbi:MAG: hypothetical protein JW870_10990 [Candidatus Delongbacteria bacterium]|nr:hypothetical protein [Candidatus Delongbacteria bacterium]
MNIYQIENRLAEASKGYFDIGISQFHKVRNINWTSFQPSLGNLCISIELMLKTLIAKNCLRYLYTNLPLELEIKLTYGKEKNLAITRNEEIGLASFTFNTSEIDRCISIFYTLYPEKKQEFKPYFNLFSFIRNISVHGAFPGFQKYDLERIAFLAIKLSEILKNENFMIFKYFDTKAENENFLKSLDNERIKRVKEVIKEATEKAKGIDYSSCIDTDDWESYVISCPICGCDGILTGSTELNFHKDKRETSEEWLQFYADSFKCNECKLELLDSKELQLAGMEISYEIDNKLEKWYREKYNINASF